MKKFAFVFAVLTAFFLVLPVCASDRTVDLANVLTEEEEIALSERLDSISEEWSCDVVVLTVLSLNGKSSQEYADDFFDENGYGFGSDYTGILFLVATADREWAFSTCGDAIRMFTDAGLTLLENNIIDHLSAGDYYTAFDTYASLCDEILENAAGGMIYDNYGGSIRFEDYYDDYYDSDDYYESDGTLSSGWIPMSVIIGFVISLIVVNIMKGEMNTVHMASGASDFIKNNSFRVTSRQDIFLYRNVTKTPRQTEQSSRPRGAGSTVHRSSSGRSHGGRSGRF